MRARGFERGALPSTERRGEGCIVNNRRAALQPPASENAPRSIPSLYPWKLPWARLLARPRARPRACPRGRCCPPSRLRAQRPVGSAPHSKSSKRARIATMGLQLPYGRWNFMQPACHSRSARQGLSSELGGAVVGPLEPFLWGALRATACHFLCKFHLYVLK